MRNVLNCKGYTLVEAIFQLVVLLLFSQLLMFFSVWLIQVEKNLFISEEVEWEMFSLDMENYLFAVTELEQQKNSMGIRFTKGGSEYDIECYPSLIRKQKNQIGHEPMLTGIKLCQLMVVNNNVITKIEFDSGRKEERTYEVFYSLE